MTHAEHAAPAGQTVFPEAEWEQFQGEDRYAGGMIVGLMTSIFSIGFVLYLVIFLIVHVS
jgi:hypothetical protein